MKTKTTFKLAAALLCLLAAWGRAGAQTDAPKFEAGAQFSTIAIDDDPSNNALCGDPCDTFFYKGVGGRFTYNVNDSLAVETEVNFFNKNERMTSRRVGGRPVQALFGVKAGKRFEKVGLFGKVRPGFLSFPDTISFGLGVGSGPLTRKTHFNLDVGGVFEVYPSRKVVLRVDAGDTIIRYGEENLAGAPSAIEGATRHNLQVNAGVGYRF